MAAKQLASHLKGGSSILPHKPSSFDNLVIRRAQKITKKAAQKATRKAE